MNRKLPQYLIWAVWLLVCGIAVAGLSNYRVDNDISQWVSTDVPQETSLNTYIIIGAPTAQVDLEQLAHQLAQSDYIQACISPGMLRTTLKDTGINPVNFVLNADKSYAGIFCIPQPEIPSAQFVNKVKNLTQTIYPQKYTQLAFGGPAIFQQSLNQYSQRGLPQITLLLLALGFVIIWWITRSITVSLSAMFAVSMSQILLLGLVSHFKIPVDMALSMVPPLMMALGYSFAAHHAIRPNISRVMFACMLTTVAGIGSFAFVNVTPLRMFALWGAIGILLVYLAVITLVPTLHTQTQHENIPPQNTPLFYQQLISRWSSPITILTIAAIASAVMLVDHVHYEHNPVEYFPTHSDIYQDTYTLNQHLTGMLPFQVSTDNPDIDLRSKLLAPPYIRTVIDATPLIKSNKRVFWCFADQHQLPQLTQQIPKWKEWTQRHNATFEWGGIAAQLAAIESTIKTTAIVSFPVMLLITTLAIFWMTRSITLAGIGMIVNSLPVALVILLVVTLDWPIGLPAVMIGAIGLGIAADDTLHLTHRIARGKAITLSLSECLLPCAGSSIAASLCILQFMWSPFAPTSQFGILMAIMIFFAMLADLLILPALCQTLGIKDDRPLSPGSEIEMPKVPHRA